VLSAQTGYVMPWWVKLVYQQIYPNLTAGNVSDTEKETCNEMGQF